MAHRSDITTGAWLGVAGEKVYETQRAHVDRAYQRMETIRAGVHAPADTRRAAADLTAALREATATVTQLLRQSQPPATSPSGRWRHHHASRAATPAVARWSSELVRLSTIEVWLRRTTLDDLGVHIPTTVRVGNYAADGPYIAGMGFGTGDLADLHEPRIGVGLPAIIDGIDQSCVAPAADAVPESAPAQAA